MGDDTAHAIIFLPPPATAAVQHRKHARSTRGIIEEAREREGRELYCRKAPLPGGGPLLFRRYRVARLHSSRMTETHLELFTT